MQEVVSGEEQQGALANRSSQRALTAGILLSISTIAAEGMGVVPALPSAVRELGGLRLFGAVFASFMLAWLVGTVLAGQLADSYGPRRPMALGLFGFGAGLLCSASAREMVQFLFGRVLQGWGGGCMLAAAFVAIARAYPDGQRSRMIALTSTVWILPAVGGPSLSGWVVEHVGWRLAFAGVVPLIALAAILVLPQLRALSVRRPWVTSLRLSAAIRLACGMGVLVFALNHLTDEPLWAGLGVGLGLGLFIPTLKTLLPAGTLRGRPVLPMGVLARGLLGFSFFGTEAFIPIASGELRGVSPMQAGLALSVAAFGWTTASWVLDRTRPTSDPDRQRMTFIEVGFAFLVLGIALVLATLLTPIPFWALLLGWTVSGLGIGLGHSASSLLCIAHAADGQQGSVSAQLQLSEALGMAMGTGIGGAVRTLMLEEGHSPRDATTAILGMTAAAALLGFLLVKRGKNIAPNAA